MFSKSPDVLLKETKIFEVLEPTFNQAPSDISVQRAIELMQEKKTRHLVIADDKKVVGIFTESNILSKIINKNVDVNSPVSAFMTKNPIVLTKDESIGVAMDLMSVHRIFHIPLIDEKQELCGLLTVQAIIRYLAECYPTEVYNLPPDSGQVMKTQEGG